MASSLNFSDDISNITNLQNDSSHTEFQKIEWLIFVYFAFLVVGCCGSLIHAAALLRSKKNGNLIIILLISLVDSISFIIATPEIVTLNRKTWSFTPELCPAFKGAEVLINTLLLNFLVLFNFHAISSWNLQETEPKKREKSPFSDNSDECLVSQQETRLVTIDYTNTKNTISTTWPTLFVLVTSLSLSIPNFLLSSIINYKNERKVCAVGDLYYSRIIQYSFLVFKNVIPPVLHLLSLTISVVKLGLIKNNEEISLKKSEARRFLTLGVVISSIYLFTSMQRHVLDITHTFSLQFNNIDNFEMPPLYNSILRNFVPTYLSMLHYSGITLRTVSILVILPKIHRNFITKLLSCCSIKTKIQL